MTANHAGPVTYHGPDVFDGRRLSPIVRERAPLLLLAVLAVVIPHILSIEQLPQKACLFFGLTGIPCPFCGLTRSLWAAANGSWLWSFAFAPLGGLVYLGALMFLAGVAVEIVAGKRIFPGLSDRLLGWAVLVVLLFNWIIHLTAI